MKMFLDTGKRAPTAMPPMDELKVILNPEECRVWSVELTLSGKLFYRKKGSLKRHYDIAEVRFISTQRYKDYAPEWSVQADFDIITSEGKVIEVSTWHRKIIESALNYVVTPDPRAGLRAARRCANA